MLFFGNSALTPSTLGQSSGAMFAGSIQDRLRARDQDKLSGYRAGHPVNVSGHVEKVTLCHQQGGVLL